MPSSIKVAELPQQELELLATAAAVRRQAWCPYSRFAVGAAVRLSDGRIFAGCNVENASSGLTICAERNAVAAAVAGGMRPGELVAVAVVGGPLAGQDNDADITEITITPCGACRQVLAEFAADGCLVLAVGVRGAVPPEDAIDVAAVYRLKELLPLAFKL